MSSNFGYIDIILLAMIAGFIFLRLRGILGRRTGFEGKAPPNFEKILKDINLEKKPPFNETFDDDAKKDFLNGAKIAYETIITDFSDNDNKIISISDAVGPEHVEVLSKNYKRYLTGNLVAGSICIGPYSSMALSDYGPTQHSLPTASSAKFSSGLGVKDFITQTSYNELSKKGVAKLGKSGILLSETESIIGHSRSIKKRMEKR